MKDLNRLDRSILICVLIYIVYNGCFMFPLYNQISQLDNNKVGVFLVAYGIIGIGLATIFKTNKTLKVFTLILVFTVLGMTGRYLLEYGEFSNTINFTSVNVLLYITIVPIYCTIVYWLKLRF